MGKMKYTPLQATALVFLRILIGWHFLYEGIAKLTNPYWSSAGYLSEARWLFASVFESIVANPTAIKLVDFLNIWGLIAVGAGLIAGCLATAASLAGIILLLLYYITNPPLIGFQSSMPAEGSYLIVDKNVIEMFALLILILFPTSRIFGLDRFIFWKKKS